MYTLIIEPKSKPAFFLINCHILIRATHNNYYIDGFIIIRFHSPIYQNIFAIIQGGTDEAFREKSAKELCALDFDGFAIGGLSVGEANQDMYDTVEWTTQFMHMMTAKS